MPSAKDFFKPLAVGAPHPLHEIEVRPGRMIHFFPPHNEGVRRRIPEIIPQVDILLGNLEDAIPADSKVAARRGLIEIAQANDFGATQLWTRINSLDSPWCLDDLMELVEACRDKLDVIMVPKVESANDIHYVDRLLAQLEGRHGLTKPLMVHAILETAAGVNNVAEIAAASPRMQGISLGPADLAASRRMKTTRVGGGHPGYLVRADADAASPDAPRSTAQQDLWHYTMAKMVDACAANGILPFYGPFGDIADSVACEDQFRNAYLMGCVGAWSLHPVQIEIAKRVFSPDPDEVAFARRIVEAIGEAGSGVAMLDGKMQDDATFKQAKVILATAELIASRDPQLATVYGFA